MQKSIDRTVFVRFVPTPSHKVMRHELEELFSQMGPIKKSSWINSSTDASKGYGFVKYVSQEDAEASTKELHNTKIQLQGNQYTLKVELASQTKTSSSGDAGNDGSSSSPSKSSSRGERHNEPMDETLLKKKSRIIVRNLSFYAKESHIKKALEEQYGPVLDVHLPKVKDNLHTGFCFVTFQNPKDAQKAVKAKEIDIKKRKATMDFSVPKKVHQQQKQEAISGMKGQKDAVPGDKDQTEQRDDDQEVDSDDASSSGGSDDNDAESESDASEKENSDDDSEGGSSDSESESDSDEEMDDAEEEQKEDRSSKMDTSGVKEKRVLFLRNLPFDTTRHDLFELFAKFGYVKAIYLVRDKKTGMPRGTAFVTYSKPQSAQRAIEQASAGGDSPSMDPSSFVSQRQASGVSSHQKKGGTSLTLKGRSIMVNLAVDKETASTFDSKEHNVSAVDRRNMYLQAEARVESSSTEPGADNTNTWDDLPEQDQTKRQNALKDKTTKLQSPLFFINPNRLSFRNMAKNVNEATLQKLCIIATKKGLEKGLVGAQDQIAQWRAKGDFSTREMLAKVQEAETEDKDIVPQWDDKANIKDLIPSVFIEREEAGQRKKDGVSRGFGFAEFKHHLHALACLRELNNNPAYSKEYVAGGAAADGMKKANRKGKGKSSKGTNGFVGEDGRVRVPRMIVDFVVRIPWIRYIFLVDNQYAECVLN